MKKNLISFFFISSMLLGCYTSAMYAMGDSMPGVKGGVILESSPEISAPASILKPKPNPVTQNLPLTQMPYEALSPESQKKIDDKFKLMWNAASPKQRADVLNFSSPLNALTEQQAATQNGPAALNYLGIDLYKQITDTHAYQNSAVSPLSVTLLLNALYFSTAGNTQQEIAKALGLLKPDDTDQFIKTIASLQHCGEQLNCPSDNLTSSSNQLLYSNALWVQSGISLNPNSIHKFDDYQIKHYYVDFNQPLDALKQINTWVRNFTRGYISELVTPDMITKKTALIATNVIYFKGLWKMSFDPSKTKPDTFTLNNGQPKSVAMMSQSNSFAYAENDIAQMVIMPYQDNNLAMAVILPKEKGNFEQFTKSLSSNSILDFINNAVPRDITVWLPKFTIESTFDSMGANLQNLGIKQIFTEQADFSPLTNSDIFLSKVIQKVYVQVDEKGTLAAVSTAAILGFTGPGPQLLKFDHPFVFIIYDTKSKLILFIGNVLNP